MHCFLRHAFLYFCLATLSSCSLPPGPLRPFAAKTTTLKEGVQYEVRPALAAKAPFEPERLKSYYVFVDPVRPPLAQPRTLAAVTPKSDVPRMRGPVNYRSVRTTAYTHDEADHIIYGNLSAVGKPLRFGHIRSAAADWSRYPLGTLFRINGQPNVLYQVDDYGSALVGTDTIDLYKPSRTAMNDWGVRHVNIEVIKWGCFHSSMNLIKDRTRYPHVRKMFDELQTRLYQTALPMTHRNQTI
jgi:3D (Asp-Asp-Asp) domain-containing protein